MRRFALNLLGTVLVVTTIVALPNSAGAEVRPVFSRGTAAFVSPTDFVGSGHAAHLGAYEEEGAAFFSPTSNPAVLNVDGWAIYTAANGDELHALIVGELNGLTGAITATVTYVGGTGRFDDASGSANLNGQMQPDGTIAVRVRGSIDY